MNTGGNPSPQQPSVDPKWSFPTANRPTDRDDDLADEPTSLLRTVPFAEARLICEKLEAEGIPCVVRCHEIEYEDLQDDSPVKVLVPESDLDRAMDIAERPIAPGEATYTDQEHLEQAVASWHCPKCHGRTLDPLPLSQGWRTVRTAWLGILVFPFAVMLLLRILPRGGLQDLVDAVKGKWEAIWGIVALILGALVVTARRHKRCSKCGWRSDGEAGFEIVRKS